jgi:hypothetical protein
MMAEILNKKNPTFIDVLRNAEKSDDPVASIKKDIADDSRVAQIIGYALNPNFKMPLPEGIPPYIPSEHPLGLAEIEILHLSSKLYVMYSNETPRIKKEQIFIQWLEKMCADEAALMVHIKDQTIVQMFPKLTEDVLVSAMGWSREQFEKLKKK